MGALLPLIISVRLARNGFQFTERSASVEKRMSKYVYGMLFIAIFGAEISNGGDKVMMRNGRGRTSSRRGQRRRRNDHDGKEYFIRAPLHVGGKRG
jgi:hypothetical protein